MIVFIFYHLSLRFGCPDCDALARARLGVARRSTLGLQGVLACQMTEGWLSIDASGLTEALQSGRQAT